MKKAAFIVLAVMLLAFGMLSNATAFIFVDGLESQPTNVFGFQTAVNPGGLGSALIYGYYNVRGNINIFNVVNTDTFDGEKVRVVFRAGKTSEEVLDFAVCLSKTDVWTAFLLDNGTTAAVCPFDTDTVTAPTIPGGCQPFIIPSGSSLTNDDLREGYFEVLGFSNIPGYDKNSTNTGADCINVLGNCITTAAQCAAWDGPFAVPSVLMGNNTIVELSTLATYSYNATAIDNWSNGFAVADPGPTNEVKLTDGTNCTTIEQMLQKTNIISPYDVMSAIGGETAVILTFPTRLECHQTEPANAPGPFNCKVFDTNNKCTSYQTPILPTVYDDKEVAATTLGFSPAGGQFLTNEVNVIEMGGSAVWNSSLAQSLATNSADGLGWVNLNLANSLGDSTLDSDIGLPVIAYTTQSFLGGAASYMVPAGYELIGL